MPTSQATEHCSSTTPSILQKEPSSRRMVVTAAIHGVYKSVNTRKDKAESGVNSAPSAAPRFAVLVPSSTARVDTTASLAVKPEISAVATRQSLKPKGLKITEINWPTSARRLSALSVTTLSLASNVCRNQMMMVARKMTVKARSRKSRAFSHSSRPTLLAEGMR